MDNANTVIRSFRDKVVADINESGLPIEVVRLTLSEIMNSINAECERILKEESQTEKGEE